MFKTQEIKDRTLHMHPYALLIMFSAFQYCEDNNLPFIVTDTVSTAREDKLLNRVSRSHLEGRSYDQSLRGWHELEIKDFMSYFEKKFRGYAAYSSKTNEPALIVRHNSGHGDHLHFQIHSRYALKGISVVSGLKD